MLSLSYKAFWLMDQMRVHAGLSVKNFEFMHGMTENTYSRILTSARKGEVHGLSGETDLRIQRTIRRLIRGYEKGIIVPGRKRVSKADLKRLDTETRNVRREAGPPKREHFVNVMQKARLLL